MYWPLRFCTQIEFQVKLIIRKNSEGIISFGNFFLLLTPFVFFIGECQQKRVVKVRDIIFLVQLCFAASCAFYISHMVLLAMCCISAFEFHYSNLLITCKLLTQSYRYHIKIRKTFGKFFRLCSKIVKHKTPKYSKIVKRLRRRMYDPVIIKRTICLVLDPSTALYRSFLKHCNLTNKAVGTIWRDLYKPSQMRQGPDSRPFWLFVGTP